MAARSFAPFRHRAFLLVWLGALVSNVGTWMETTALSFYVADTSSAGASGLVAAAGFIPMAVLGPVGGAWADRFDRRKIIIAANTAMGLVAAAVALLVAAGEATAGHLAVLSLIGGSAGALGWPSFQAVLPGLVPPEDLVAAIGLSSTQWNLGRILGPSAAALAIAIGGVPAALWVNAASFLAVIAAVVAARIARHVGTRRSVLVSVADAARFARDTPAVRAMLPVMAVVVFVASPFLGLVAQMATNVFGSGQGGTSLLVTAQGVGAVLAGTSMGSLSARFGVRSVLACTAVLLVPTLVVYGAAPNIGVAAIGLAMAGYCYMAVLSSCTSITQRSAPPEVRGRAMIANNVVLGAAYPLGVLVQGVLADATSLRTVTIGSGLVLGACALMLASIRPRHTVPIALLDATV